MAPHDFEQEQNPFAGSVPDVGPSDPRAVDFEMVKKFRQQIHALGGVWIIIGALSAGLGVVGLAAGPDARILEGEEAEVATFVFGLLAFMGTLWVVLGVFTCFKQIWAVWVGLVLSYLSLAGNVLNLNLCGGVIVVAILFQAHRVLGWAKQMQEAGVPLTAKP